MDATAIVLILLAAVVASHASGFALGRVHERNERIRRRVGSTD
jgi:hypothetical protein